MKFPKKPVLVKTESNTKNVSQVEKILIAKEVKHSGAIFAAISNGGKFSIGQYVIEFVRDGSQFVTIQVYQSALGITPKVQSWQRTKTVKAPAKASKPKAQKELKTETLTVNTKIESEDLF